jgi:hypothetical protein
MDSRALATSQFGPNHIKESSTHMMSLSLRSSIPQTDEAAEAAARGTLPPKTSAMRREANTPGGIAMDAKRGACHPSRSLATRSAGGRRAAAGGTDMGE